MAVFDFATLMELTKPVLRGKAARVSRLCRLKSVFLPGRGHFAQLVKVYGASREGEQRYSPAEVVDAVPMYRLWKS